jgi:tetratricopeptide (TPR) repeat protein
MMLLLVLLALAKDDGAKAYNEGRYADAAAFYQKAVDKRPTAELQLALGRCRVQLKEWGAAAEAFRGALALQPELGAEIHRALGQSLVMAGRVDEGLASLRRAQALDPRGDDAIWAARALAQKGAFAAAEIEAAKLPDSEEAVELLAWLWARRGRYAEAAELYRGLARRSPAAVKHWLALGQAEAAAGRESDAVVALETARRLGRLDAAGLRLLADLCLRAGLHREAADAYAALPAPTADDLLRLGHARLQADEAVSAREAFEKALAADPARADAALQLGRLAADPAEARRRFAQAMKADATSPLPCSALGDLEAKAGAWAAAAEAFGEALRRGDRSAAAHHQHALALKQAGNLEAADAALREGLREHPLDDRLRALLKER